VAQIRRKGPNKYLIVIYLGRDANGKRVEESEVFHGSLPRAKLRAAERETELKKRLGPTSLAMNLGDYLEKMVTGDKGLRVGTIWFRKNLLFSWGFPA